MHTETISIGYSVCLGLQYSYSVKIHPICQLLGQKRPKFVRWLSSILMSKSGTHFCHFLPILPFFTFSMSFSRFFFPKCLQEYFLTTFSSDFSFLFLFFIFFCFVYVRFSATRLFEKKKLSKNIPENILEKKSWKWHGKSKKWQNWKKMAKMSARLWHENTRQPADEFRPFLAQKLADRMNFHTITIL